MVEQFIKFCVVGASGMVVDFSATYLCKEQAKLNKYLANALGFMLAASSNYLLNRLWTFHSQRNVPVEYLKFIGVSLIGLGLNSAVVYLLTEKLRLNFYLAKLLAIATVTLWNFLMSYFFTFR
jgi:putative flippase GtrA